MLHEAFSASGATSCSACPDGYSVLTVSAVRVGCTECFAGYYENKTGYADAHELYHSDRCEEETHQLQGMYLSGVTIIIESQQYGKVTMDLAPKR